MILWARVDFLVTLLHAIKKIGVDQDKIFQSIFRKIDRLLSFFGKL